MNTNVENLIKMNNEKEILEEKFLPPIERKIIFDCFTEICKCSKLKWTLPTINRLFSFTYINS